MSPTKESSQQIGFIASFAVNELWSVGADIELSWENLKSYFWHFRHVPTLRHSRTGDMLWFAIIVNLYIKSALVELQSH